MSKILITGGAGFIGFHLAKHLASQKHEVTICDNLSRGKMDSEAKVLLEQPNVSFVQCDLTRQEELSKLGGPYDHVYHLAAVQGTKNFYEKPLHVVRTNILSTINVLDWFVASRSRKILFSSSSETYAGTINKLGNLIPTPEHIPLMVEDVYNPRWSYGTSKIAGEVLFANYGKTHGIDFVIIRYHNIYGPRMGYDHVIPEFIVRTLKGENPFSIFGGIETRAFCYVEDAVRASQLLMESSATAQTIHIGNDKTEINIADLARKVHSLMRVSPTLAVKPAPEGSVKRRCPDITKLRSFAYEPQVSLEEGLKRTIEWYARDFESKT